MNQRRAVHMLTAITLILLLLCSCSKKAPTIQAVTLKNEAGEEVTEDESGWYELSSHCTIEVQYEGTATLAEFYTVPTGTEVEWTLTKTVELNGDDSAAVFEWDVPNSFLGYFKVMVYNGEACTQSYSTKAAMLDS
ncbi:MAG: hypothetical protein LUB63_00795 [Oscillospiraceae bacterium]|nr:hypothetical protein [Oscillospiraceae bacterium]